MLPCGLVVDDANAGVHAVDGTFGIAAGEKDEGEVPVVFHLQFVVKTGGVRFPLIGVGGLGSAGVNIGVDGFLDVRVVVLKDGIGQLVVVAGFRGRPDAGSRGGGGKGEAQGKKQGGKDGFHGESSYSQAVGGCGCSFLGGTPCSLFLPMRPVLSGAPSEDAGLSQTGDIDGGDPVSEAGQDVGGEDNEDLSLIVDEVILRHVLGAPLDIFHGDGGAIVSIEVAGALEPNKIRYSDVGEVGERKPRPGGFVVDDPHAGVHAVHGPCFVAAGKEDKGKIAIVFCH